MKISQWILRKLNEELHFDIEDTIRKIDHKLDTHIRDVDSNIGKNSKNINSLFEALEYVYPNFQKILPLVSELNKIEYELNEDKNNREERNFLFGYRRVAFLTEENIRYYNFRINEIKKEIDILKNGEEKDLECVCED